MRMFVKENSYLSSAQVLALKLARGGPR